MNSTSYSCGYNGQEKSLEIDANGNHNTAEYWEMDSRSGRRWNLDPVVYPEQSGYSLFNNSPIALNDPLGLEGDSPLGFGSSGGGFWSGVGDFFSRAWDSACSLFGGGSDKGTEITIGKVTQANRDSERGRTNEEAGRVAAAFRPKEQITDFSLSNLKQQSQFGDPVATSLREDISGFEKWLLVGAQSSYEARREWAAGGDMMYGGYGGSSSAIKVVEAEVGVDKIGLTAHGAERVAGATATRGGVLSFEEVATTKLLGRQFKQADGANVFLHEISQGRFNAVIQNQTTGKVITTMRNWSQKSINRIGKNYGWPIQ